MSYLTGTANSGADYIAQLHSFLLGIGWVTDYWEAGESGVTDTTMVMHFNDQYFEATASTTHLIYAQAGLGFDGVDRVSDGAHRMLMYDSFPQRAITVDFWGYTTGQFFSTYERQANTFSWMSSGKVQSKYVNSGSEIYGAGTTRGYNNQGIGILLANTSYQITASFQMHMSNDISTGHWFDNGYSTAAQNRAWGGNASSDNIWYGLNAQAYRVSSDEHVSMWPTLAFMAFDGSANSGGTIYFLAAEVPNIKLCSGLLFNPREVTQSGADQYMIMPRYQKVYDNPYAGTGSDEYAFALRMEP